MSPKAIRPSMLLFLIVLNLVAAGFYFAWANHRSRPLKIQPGAPIALATPMRLPDFQLVDTSSQTVTRKDFDGKVWILNFIYTHCPAQCPMVTNKLSALQKSLPAHVGLASFSVDPEHDSPKALSGFAENYNADLTRWKFLTGSKTEIEKVLSALGASGGAAAESHSLRLYLIDQQGLVVGTYNTDEEGALSRMAQKAESLAKKDT